jgi:hypothetical protein
MRSNADPHTGENAETAAVTLAIAAFFPFV